MMIPFDSTDPVVALLAWGLTLLVGKLIDLTQRPKLRTALPIMAVLLAVAARSAIAAMDGTLYLDGMFHWDILLRGLAAGAAAVLGHSQMRELLKLVGTQAPASGGGASGGGIGAAMLLIVMGGAIASTQTGCVSRYVLRDRDTYTTQVRWLEARNSEDISAFELAVAQSIEHGDMQSCLVYAEQLQLARYATAWRYKMMLFLADQGEDPGEPPLVPEASALCEGVASGTEAPASTTPTTEQ